MPYILSIHAPYHDRKNYENAREESIMDMYRLDSMED